MKPRDYKKLTSIDDKRTNLVNSKEQKSTPIDLFNREQIVQLISKDKKRYKYFEDRVMDMVTPIWYEQRIIKRWLRSKKRYSAGFYVRKNSFLKVRSEQIKDWENDRRLVIEDFKVWVRPVVQIHLSNKDILYKYFDTLEQANDYIQILRSDKIFIEDRFVTT